MPKWDEITRNEKYQNLPPEARAQIKTSWFETNLLPEIEKRPSLKEMGVDKVYQWFMQQPDDTGQGYVSSMLGAAGRGFGEVVPGAIEGVGALTGLEGLRETGQELRSGLESISPVNPIYAESVPVKLAGVGGQIGSVVATAGTGGLAGKVLGGVGAVSKGAKAASLGSAFLQGAAEGAREAEQYGMTGPEAYLRTLAGGATQAGTELLPFGMAAETALAKRVLAGTPRTGTFLGATASEGAEESLAQIGSNIATKLLAPVGVETPDITAGALEAGLYGAAGGAMLGGVNALISTPPERQTQIQKDLQAEAGAIPKDAVPDQTNEEKLAAMEAGGTTVVDPDGKTAVIPPQQPELPSMPSPDEVAVQLNTDAAKSLEAAGSPKSAKAQVGFDATLKEILPKTSQPTIPTLEEAEKAPTPTPISIADSPSPNLPPRATENVEPKPTRNAGESRNEFLTRRDAWDEQYGDMRKGGRTHNDDGTPYQPTVYDEMAPAILAARQQMTDEEANERIGEWSDFRIGSSIRTLINAGWTWDAANKRWQQPVNNPVPNEAPAQAIIRLQGQTQPAAAPIAPSTPQPAVAPAKQSAAEKALGLPAGTLTLSATPPSPAMEQAAAPAVEEPTLTPEPELYAPAQVPSEESVFEEPQDGAEGGATKKASLGDRILGSKEGEVEGEVMPLPEVAADPFAAAPLVDNLPALVAVRDNNATPEQVQSLVDQGLVEQVDGQNIITEAGVAAMPEDQRPKLTPAERAAEVKGMGVPVVEAPTKAQPKPSEAIIELTELPMYFLRNPQQKKLWNVDELYAEPARISQSISDKIGPQGTAFTVEQLMNQIAALRDFVSSMNGRLLRGGDKGASAKELAENWTTLRGFEALAIDYAAKNPQEWQNYRNRQNELLGLESGADVIAPYPSPDIAPIGKIGKLDKKFSKNWRVIFPNGETALFHPTALRAVSSTIETIGADVIEELTPFTQAQKAIVDKLPELEARDAQRKGLGFDYPRAKIGRFPGDQNVYISRLDQKNVGVLSPDGSIKMLSPEDSLAILSKINDFEKRQAAQMEKRMAVLREEAKKQSESKLYQLTPSGPIVRRLDGKWINNSTGKPLGRSKNDQRLLSQLENNPNIEFYQVVAQSTDGGVSFVPVNRVAQPTNQPFATEPTAAEKQISGGVMMSPLVKGMLETFAQASAAWSKAKSAIREQLSGTKEAVYLALAEDDFTMSQNGNVVEISLPKGGSDAFSLSGLGTTLDKYFRFGDAKGIAKVTKKAGEPFKITFGNEKDASDFMQYDGRTPSELNEDFKRIYQQLSESKPQAAEKPTPDSVAVEPGATRGVQAEPVGGSIPTVGKDSPETEISSRENLGPEVAAAEKKQAAADEAAKKRQKKQDESTKNSLNSILDPQKKNAVTGTVTKADVETAREALTNSGEIPNAYLTNVYESVEAFLADKANARLFPSAYARLQTEKNIEGLYENGQTLIFAKQIQVSNLDRNLAKMLGITPEQAAARRVIAHENGHKAISLFTMAEKRELRGYLMRAYSDEQIAKLVETYDEYADWRTNLESRFEALEELLMRDFEKMDKIPTGGVWDDIVQFLKRVWRRLTGQKGEPTLKNLKDVARLMRNAMKRPAVALGSFTLKDGGKVKLSFIGEKAIENLPTPTPVIDIRKLNAEYLAAVESGDSGNNNLNQLLRNASPDERQAVVDSWIERNPWTAAKIQRMVKEMAKARGYDIEAYHGSSAENDFNVFDAEKILNEGAGVGFYFALDKRLAQEYANKFPKGKVFHVFLKQSTPLKTEVEYPSTPSNDLEAFNNTVEAITKYGQLSSFERQALKKSLSQLGAAPNLLSDPSYFQTGLRAFFNSKEFQNFNSRSKAYLLSLYEILAGKMGKQWSLDTIGLLTRMDGLRFTDPGVFTVLRPNQIKSANPVTYDDNGNVIPLSQRFQPTSPDIRFSRPQFASDTDAATSAGNEAARSTIYSERDMDVREAIRRAYEAMPKNTSVAVPIGELFAKTEELMPGVTQDEFSNVLQDLFEDNGAVLQEGDVVEPLTEQDRRYLALAEDEEANQEELQEMVDEAAKAAGYDVGPVYHGSRSDFTSFSTKYLGNDIGFHFGTAEQADFRVGDDGAVRGFHIQIKNPLRLEDQGGWYGYDVVQMVNAAIGSKLNPSASTSAIRRAIQDAGYDGVVYQNKFEGFGDSYVAFSPSQIKSADPVTRDDQGRIIPLSRRFDTDADIRGQINVTTPEGRRAGFVVVMPKAAKASKIPIEDAEEASKSFKVDLAEAGKGRVDKKAKFKGIPLKDTEIPEHNVKSYVLYRDSAIKLIDDLMAKTNDILVVAEALQDPEFQIAIGLQVSKDVSSDMITIARNQIGIEIENRLANEIRKERNPRRKRELELAEKRGIIYYNAGTGAGQALQNRQESLTDPRYRGRNLFNQAKLQKEQKAKDKLDAITGGTEKITDIITKAEEKAAEETTQAEVEAQESAVEDDQDAIELAAGEATLNEENKSLWNKVKDWLREIGAAMNHIKSMGGSSKASISAAQRSEISKMSREEALAFIEDRQKKINKALKTLLGEESEAKTPEQKKTRKKREKMVNTAKKRAEAGKSLETPQEGETESSEEQVSKAERTAQAILKDLSERYSDPLIIKEKKPNVDAMRELYKERVKQGVGSNQMTEKSFVNKAVELGADETTAGILWKAAELEIDAREAMRQDKILQRKAAVGARADAQAHRIIFAKERLKRQSGFARIDTNPNKDTIIQAFRDQVKNPVNLEDFVARLKSLNVSETVAKRLFTAADREKTDLEAVKKFQAETRALEEIEIAENKASQIIYRFEEQYRQGFKNPPEGMTGKEQRDSIIRAFRDQVKNPTSFEVFAERLAKLKVGNEIAERMFLTASRERADLIRVKDLKIANRKVEIASKQASRLIYNTEERLRQGSKDLEESKNGDSINKAFRDQISEPVSEKEFKQRLEKLNVPSDVAARLFKTAAREKADLEAMEAFKALEGPDALKRMLNEMNKARPADSVPLERAMPWRKILSSNPKDVAEYRQRIFEAISDLPSFQNLTDEQKERLADLYAEAWENRKQAILDRMLRDEIKKARDRDEISEDVEKKLQQSRNKILEIVNLGGFNNDDLVKVLGERYGISTSFTEEQKERIQKLADQLQDEDMNTAKRNKLAMEFAVELAGAMDVPVSEIISNWWTSSVLFGPQTIFSIGAAFLNGGYSIATIGTRRMLAKLVKGDIQGAIEESILMLKGFARYLGAFKQSGRRAWSYLWTGDVGLLGTGSTDILSEINNFDQLQRFQRHKLLAEKLAKDPRMVRRYVGVYLRFVSRLLTALDAFNVMVTKAGTASLALRMSGMSTDKIIEAEKMLNLKAYKDQVIRDYFDNKAPKTQAEKALVDSYAEAEMYRAINKLGGKMENADYLASESAMTMHPTGFGGVVYDAITGFFAQRQSNADEYLEKMKKDWISNKDLKAVTFLALAYLRQFAAYNAAGLTGSKFVRYASNKFNQGLSFIPFAGLLRQIEAKDDRIKGKDAFRETIYRNQIVSFVMLMVGYSVIKAIQDEPDDEERGNFWNGGWANLTPDQKKQMLAKGQKEYTMGFKFNGRWYVFNYQNWPLNQILSAIGSMSDQVRFSPEKWDEKSALSKGVAGMVSGVKSTLEIPALSGLQELVGNRLASKDPTEKDLDRLSRVASGWVGGFVPRILKDIDFYTQPELRKYEGLWEKTASHIPIYRRYIGEEYYDILGKQIKRNVIPGSREFMMGPTEPEYKILGALNARNIFLTPANAEYRMVGKGRNRRRLTQEEADAYSLETGRGYRDMLLRYGQRALQMPTERARAFLQDKAEEVRDRALKRAYRR